MLNQWGFFSSIFLIFLRPFFNHKYAIVKVYENKYYGFVFVNWAYSIGLPAGQEEEDTKVRVARRLEPKPHVGKSPNINTAHPYTTQLRQCPLQTADFPA